MQMIWADSGYCNVLRFKFHMPLIDCNFTAHIVCDFNFLGYLQIGMIEGLIY